MHPLISFACLVQDHESCRFYFLCSFCAALFGFLLENLGFAIGSIQGRFTLFISSCSGLCSFHSKADLELIQLLTSKQS